MVSLVYFDCCRCRLRFYADHPAACCSGYFRRYPRGGNLLGSSYTSLCQNSAKEVDCISIFRILQISPTVFLRIDPVSYLSEIAAFLCAKNAFAIVSLLTMAKASKEEVIRMNLTNAKEGVEYTVTQIQTDDDELDAFLFSLGCYSGERITLISRQRGNYVIAVKDGRYSVDPQLAEAIMIS